MTGTQDNTCDLPPFSAPFCRSTQWSVWAARVHRWASYFSFQRPYEQVWSSHTARVTSGSSCATPTAPHLKVRGGSHLFLSVSHTQFSPKYIKLWLFRHKTSWVKFCQNWISDLRELSFTIKFNFQDPLLSFSDSNQSFVIWYAILRYLLC